MSYRINTNVASLNAQANSALNSRNLTGSLGKLSSGLRINSAADDASGMNIADSLRSQASALGQAISNGNDAIGIVQTADKAMDEQIKILDTIKQKAIQAAQAGQNRDSRAALQSDINKLLEELDNIANTTAFNGQQLLNGTFSNKNFQIGAYSNETVKVNIGATESTKIGHTRFETTGNTIYSSASKAVMGAVRLGFSGIDGYPKGIMLRQISANDYLTQGLAAVAKQVNEMTQETGIRASVNNSQVMETTLTGGTIRDLELNGVYIGNITMQAGDSDGVLVRAINDKTESHGIVASVENGRLTLTARDGRSIRIRSGAGYGATKANLSILGFNGAVASGFTWMGQMTFVRQDARDIKLVVSATNGAGADALYAFSKTTIAAPLSTIGTKNSSNRLTEASISLKQINNSAIDIGLARAMGAYNPLSISGTTVRSNMQSKLESGVTTYAGAQAMIDIAESARKTLDKIRSDLGSVQNQLISTINNITVTQVNVKSAESQIRDVDFANESANFSKYNILAQSGAYAMTQANASQQNVLRLLQ